jgi:hypothetical protein
MAMAGPSTGDTTLVTIALVANLVALAIAVAELREARHLAAQAAAARAAAAQLHAAGVPARPPVPGPGQAQTRRAAGRRPPRTSPALTSRCPGGPGVPRRLVPGGLAPARAGGRYRPGAPGRAGDPPRGVRRVQARCPRTSSAEVCGQPPAHLANNGHEPVARRRQADHGACWSLDADTHI